MTALRVARATRSVIVRMRRGPSAAGRKVRTWRLEAHTLAAGRSRDDPAEKSAMSVCVGAADPTSDPPARAGTQAPSSPPTAPEAAMSARVLEPAQGAVAARTTNMPIKAPALKARR